MTFLTRQIGYRGRWGAALAVAVYGLLTAAALLVGLIAGIVTVGVGR